MRAPEAWSDRGAIMVVGAAFALTSLFAAILAVLPAPWGPATVGVLAVACAAVIAVMLLPAVRGLLSEHALLYGPIVLLFMSMIKISVRDPVGGAGGPQQLYELGLQGVAVALTAVALLTGRCRVKLSAVTILWVLFALFAFASALWSAHPFFTALKATQLLAVTLVLCIVAPNLPSRDGAARFLGYLGLMVFSAILLGEIATGGLSAAWRPYEASSLEFVGGRYRLSLLAIYPLTLGDVAGTLALLLIVSRRRRLDVVAACALLGMVFLSFSRAAEILAIPFVASIFVLETLPRQSRRLPAIVLITVSLAALLAGLLYAVNTASPPSLSVPGMNSSDATSLNGRTPLWSDTWNSFAASSEHLSGALFGHGFGSFRYFGLQLFNYAGEAHSSPLQVLFELGLLGLGLWAAAAIFSLLGAARGERSLPDRVRFLLPIAYLLMLEMLDSALADSRSFELMLVLVCPLAALSVAEKHPAMRKVATSPVRLLARRSPLVWQPARVKPVEPQ